MEFINGLGGVEGLRLRLDTEDYASDLSQAISSYKKYQQDKSLFAIVGWGAADTHALSRLTARDKIVYLSAAGESDLTDPKKAPYNFFIGPSYSDQLRLALAYAKENGARKVTLIYPDHPYGLGPLKAGREMAESLGLEVGPDVQLGLRAVSAEEQIKALQDFDPDFAWVGGTSVSTAVLIRDAAAHGIRTRFLVNSWGLSDRLAAQIGGAAEGRLFGFQPVRPFGFDVPETTRIFSMSGNRSYGLQYNQAWAGMMVLWAGLTRADAEGRLNGPGLKAALETLQGFETGGLTPPLTFTPDDHRSTLTAGLYKVSEGRLSLVTDVTLERKMEHLGW